MNATRLRQVRRAFPHIPSVPASTIRHNRRAWIRSIRELGDKWLLAEPVAKREAA
jgi:hypothetical protein